jgi:23S rRNA (uracil1939-C5)-methyltransferase
MERAALRTGDPRVVTVESSAHDGRGITHVDGKVTFVDGALPGERVAISVHQRRRTFDEAVATEIVESSPERVSPPCAHFGVCGGCVLQHASGDLQRRIKQQALADSLERIAGVVPERWLPPIAGPEWAYRRRARLSSRFVESKGRTLVGFRERGRPYVADLKTCQILGAPVGELIEPLATLIGGLERAREIPQVEVAIADTATALVVRHLAPMGDTDRAALKSFGAAHGIDFYLQAGGYDTLEPLVEPARALEYTLPEHEVTIRFGAGDFIQVNAEVNRQLVGRAMELLAPGTDERFIDLFCGLGNFSLPLARRCGTVTGVEGDERLVRGAVENAARNGITNAGFHTADLFSGIAGAAWAEGRYDGVILDPPRAGARELIPAIDAWRPSRVLYISCHPGTLARDTGLLVGTHGFRLAAAGIADMFPHTAHVESVALFER